MDQCVHLGDLQDGTGSPECSTCGSLGWDTTAPGIDQGCSGPSGMDQGVPLRDPQDGTELLGDVWDGPGLFRDPWDGTGLLWDLWNGTEVFRHPWDGSGCSAWLLPASCQQWEGCPRQCSVSPWYFLNESHYTIIIPNCPCSGT